MRDHHGFCDEWFVDDGQLVCTPEVFDPWYVLRATPRGGQGGLAAHRSPSDAAPRGWVCPGRATADAPGHRHRARPPGGTHEPRVLADDVAPGRRQ